MPLETITWTSPTGTQIVFDGTTGYAAAEGPGGRYLPPVEPILREDAGTRNTRILAVKYKPRTITIALRVDGTTASQCRARVRDLANAFAPQAGDGTLTFATPVGDSRQIGCRYVGGLEGDDQINAPSLTEWRGTAQFLAPEPFLTDTADTTQSWTLGTAQHFFPLLPLRLSSSQVFAGASISAAGDVDAEIWPVWTIVGPGSQLVLTNTTTGRTLAWGGTLAAGETLTIDTRPGSMSVTPKTILAADGTNEGAQVSQWDFWPLIPGTQALSIQLAGATGASLVSARWRALWLTT